MQIDYYLVRYVDLQAGKFIEAKMSQHQMYMLEIINHVKGNIQILSKCYTETLTY